MIIRLFLPFMIICTIVSCKQPPDYYHLPTKVDDTVFNAVIEIPAGTNKKIEYNKDTHSFEIDQKNGKDRVVQFLPYLGNYGFIPSTYSNPAVGGDGDALDVLVLSESVSTGTLLEILPIAVLKLLDDGELDHKIIAVPADKSVQIINARSYKELNEKFPEIIQMIESWFLNYNKDDEVKVNGWGDRESAIEEILKNSIS